MNWGKDNLPFGLESELHAPHVQLLFEIISVSLQLQNCGPFGVKMVVFTVSYLLPK